MSMWNRRNLTFWKKCLCGQLKCNANWHEWLAYNFKDAALSLCVIHWKRIANCKWMDDFVTLIISRLPQELVLQVLTHPLLSRLCAMHELCLGLSTINLSLLELCFKLSLCSSSRAPTRTHIMDSRTTWRTGSPTSRLVPHSALHQRNNSIFALKKAMTCTALIVISDPLSRHHTFTVHDIGRSWLHINLGCTILATHILVRRCEGSHGPPFASVRKLRGHHRHYTLFGIIFITTLRNCLCQAWGYFRAHLDTLVAHLANARWWDDLPEFIFIERAFNLWDLGFS